MTLEIALLMVCSAARVFGHLLPGPYLYLSLTLMRTFLLASSDYLVVMTHPGRQPLTIQGTALELHKLDIEADSGQAALNKERGIHLLYVVF